MVRTILKSKIHRATITQADLSYEGSLTIDNQLMEMADILPYEMVYVYNINNGERFETYAIAGEAGSGVMCLNGAAARKGMPGDLIIITTFAGFAAAELEEHQPKLVYVDACNRPKLSSPKKVLAL
ncbi:aspartate 1-decarboxylase [Desulfobacca acetoxidans]|uniref:Aspartate 1-decarboxylase n=1 Tax=Desulfobacca acetoxidans (strain ATCC 700848 / DSM 11109 / ASRB2) TaxID=880072 RepID=F2NJ81_DESAR|nr:aspartate 1-decarboxylase [Desulfobacca acetoxidans]AEB09253.1 Aspartate 1-decarboxylase [Desulfobacca acetoxidans DSM 11109]HAY22397.1 aspartate 1-decarboxylase [Desulfobacterales bacterium]